MACTFGGGVVVLVLALTAITVQDTTDDFKDQTPKHSYCFEDHDNIAETGVSEADKEVIVAYHNKVRREVKPVATDLTAVVWDENLAKLAQKWSQQCAVRHDKNRKLPAYGKSIGQNIAAGQPNWSKAMLSWFKESNFFKYGEDPKVYLGPGGWARISHYTIMVSNRTQRIGCGFTRCDDVRFGRFYVCNYAQGQLSFRYPYTKGPSRCSSCPDSCKNGLCDCGGLLCLNKGKLDINSCSCNCQKIYKGANCTELDCPTQDKWNCGTRLPPSYCTKYSNIPFDCPYMCGVCPPK
ncbi:cysteine-rich venom protein [Elysia marginata]|uniref:Cysteine-rich venom protein n=1 Tax=Elysia marginata TaxID=1093978 RepID=A0AAV4J912_9GAST|nr:cysteine-rich venom protein [Elysia marginata]